MQDKRRIILKVCVLLSMALALDGCRGLVGRLRDRNAENLPIMETGIYYRGDREGEAFLVCFTHSTARKAEGHYYRQSEAPFAEPHTFTLRNTDRVRFTEEDLVPYRAPHFRPVDRNRYRESHSEVKLLPDVEYGHASGYWTSLQGEEDDIVKIFTQSLARTFNRKSDQTLTMDIYLPEDVRGEKPLIMFMHGGAFYIGDKAEPCYVDFCRYFASLGYVAASINYRMGFHASKAELERAGYSALQDAHAAMRFLVSHAEEYEIDPDLLFVAGSSAGSMTALNLAFMREENRPESSRGTDGLFRKEDMGSIDSSGNDIEADFHVKAVCNMWGALSDLGMLGNSSTDIISFHGDADSVVPYDYGHPFQAAGKLLSTTLSDPMYGSKSIDREAAALGLRSVLHTFPGQGHALNAEKWTKFPNANHAVIKEEMTSFLFEEIVPQQAEITESLNGDYFVSGTDIEYVQWEAEGGFVLDEPEFGASVLWRADAPEHRLTATGSQAGGAGFLVTRDIN